MPREKKMRKRTSKSSWTPAALLLVLALTAGSAGAQRAGRRQKPPAGNPAVIAGSVFREDGFSVRGARVLVLNSVRPKERKETTTDLQGEFAVRLPAGKASYAVEVSAEGFTPGRKTVEIAGDERVDLTFHLVRAGK